MNGFTPDLREGLIRYGVRQVLIAFDNDKVGNAGAQVLAVELQRLDIDTWRVVFPPEMDANNYLCLVAEADIEFGLLVSSAVRIEPVGLPADWTVYTTRPDRTNGGDKSLSVCT